MRTNRFWCLYFYNKKHQTVEFIKLNGSIELAPIVGLSEVIVDIVETGKTLYENNLEPYETIVPISARFVANKAAYRFKRDEINLMVEKISEKIN